MAAERLLEPGWMGHISNKLNQQLVVKRCNIMDLKRQWEDDVRLTLETKKLHLLDQLHVEKRNFTRKRNGVTYTLNLRSSQKQRSYIHGIKEITKNSRKLDTDIRKYFRGDQGAIIRE